MRRPDASAAELAAVADRWNDAAMFHAAAATAVLALGGWWWLERRYRAIFRV